MLLRQGPPALDAAGGQERLSHAGRPVPKAPVGQHLFDHLTDLIARAVTEGSEQSCAGVPDPRGHAG